MAFAQKTALEKLMPRRNAYARDFDLEISHKNANDNQMTMKIQGALTSKSLPKFKGIQNIFRRNATAFVQYFRRFQKFWKHFLYRG